MVALRYGGPEPNTGSVLPVMWRNSVPNFSEIKQSVVLPYDLEHGILFTKLKLSQPIQYNTTKTYTVPYVTKQIRGTEGDD